MKAQYEACIGVLAQGTFCSALKPEMLRLQGCVYNYKYSIWLERVTTLSWRSAVLPQQQSGRKAISHQGHDHLLICSPRSALS